MKREPGYYWVKVKNDPETVGDLEILMGYMSPKGQWVICYFDGEGWNYWNKNLYDIYEDYFEQINETRILSPDEDNPGGSLGNLLGTKYLLIKHVDETDQQFIQRIKDLNNIK